MARNKKETHKDSPKPLVHDDDVMIVEDEATAITVTGQDTSVSLVDQFHPGMTGSTTLVDIYDRYQKKIYLLDKSSSMNEGMLPDDMMKAYKWGIKELDAARKVIADRVQALIALKTGIEAIAGIDYENQSLSDEDVIRTAMEVGLIDSIEQKMRELYGGYPCMHRTLTDSHSKMEIVQGAMRDFVEQRFARFPDAQVALWTFDTSVSVRATAGAPKETILAEIDGLHTGGGTSIKPAVERALAEFKKRPSHMGAHHIVLVSDGQDYTAEELPELVPQMKELNVVFDFIYIMGMSDALHDKTEPEGHRYDGYVNAIRKTAKATGGEYFEVSKPHDFKTKFLQVSNRPALPPGSSL